MLTPSDNNQSDVIEVFDPASRYLNDLLNIDNSYCKQMVNHVYPTKLILKKILSYWTWTCP